MPECSLPVPERRVADLLLKALRAERSEYINNGGSRDFAYERVQDAAWQYVATLREAAALQPGASNAKHLEARPADAEDRQGATR
jgi:hypothetical protein